MGIKEFLKNKVIANRLGKALGIIATSQDKRIANSVIMYVDSKIQEISDNPETSAEKAFNLGLSTLSVLCKLVGHNADIQELTAGVLHALTKKALSSIPEYFPLIIETPEKIENFLKNIDDYVSSQPEDTKKLLSKYIYDMQVKINDIIEKVAKDVIVNFTKELIDQYSMGRFIKLFISEEDISSYLEKFAAQNITQKSFIPVKHEDAGTYTTTELSDDDGWVKVDLGEIPSLSEWIQSRFINITTNITNRVTSDFSDLFSKLYDKAPFVSKMTEDSSFLPQIQKSLGGLAIVDNDYTVLCKLREKYVALEKEIIDLQQNVNNLIDTDNLGLQSISPANNRLIKELLEHYKEKLKSTLDKCYNDQLPSVQNKNRLNGYKQQFEKIINELYNSIDEKIDDKIAQLPANLEDSRNVPSRQNSMASMSRIDSIGSMIELPLPETPRSPAADSVVSSNKDNSPDNNDHKDSKSPISLPRR